LEALLDRHTQHDCHFERSLQGGRILILPAPAGKPATIVVETWRQKKSETKALWQA
jgi:hypothetical protein